MAGIMALGKKLMKVERKLEFLQFDYEHRELDDDQLREFAHLREFRSSIRQKLHDKGVDYRDL